MTKPRLLDLFCGAGGAAMGYHRAGLEVVGVDLDPQPHYPFEFHQADALTFPLEGFDAIHASPPCQAYSFASQTHRAAGKEYPDLVARTRRRLEASGVPWVIENVPGAPVRRDIELCGCMVGLPQLRRVRWFEANWGAYDLTPPHCHTEVAVSVAGHSDPSWVRQMLSRRGLPRHTASDARRAMGIDWMNRAELSQAIPPAYTEWIGKRLLRVVVDETPTEGA